MPEGEQSPQYPEWAEHERLNDLAWITENLSVFWPVAQAGYTRWGRGAIWVDTTIQPTGEGNPFGYIPQEHLDEVAGEDERRMIAEYEPAWQLVAILFKERERVSSYRVGLPQVRDESGRKPGLGFHA